MYAYTHMYIVLYYVIWFDFSRNATRNIHQIRFVPKPGLGIPSSSTPYLYYGILCYSMCYIMLYYITS